jgi:hypothetical protein
MAKEKKAKQHSGAQPFHAVQTLFLFLLPSLFVVFIYRFIFPGQGAPLPVFALPWRLNSGGVSFIELFPALAFSALIVSFGIRKAPAEQYASFSLKFLDVIRGHILAAIIASVLYGILFLFAYPLLLSGRASMNFDGYLFRSSKERAAEKIREQSWVEAGRFLAICERIWTASPETEVMRVQVDIGLEDLRRSESGQSIERPASPAGAPAAWVPVDAVEAYTLARRAFDEERYYDAHWYATLAGRLSGAGSAGHNRINQLAGRAWNAIASLEPNSREQRSYSLYHKKRDGYNALVSADWIRAYYIFKELASLSPDDIDVKNFLAMSEAGLKDQSFFIDELDTAIGEILNGAVFSLPRIGGQGLTANGRIVVRFASLSNFKDFSYAIGIEALGFDPDASLVWRLEAPYAKIQPLSGDAAGRTVLLLRALDRENQRQRWEPRWEGQGGLEPDTAQLTMDIAYEDFILSAEAARGLESLSIRDLLNGASRLGNKGHIPELFRAEALHRLGGPMVFLPFAIIAVIIGWRFRAGKNPRYLGIPMLGIIPLVFSAVSAALRAAEQNLGSLMVLTLPFSLVLGLFIVGILVFFFITLIILAGQHG